MLNAEENDIEDEQSSTNSQKHRRIYIQNDTHIHKSQNLNSKLLYVLKVKLASISLELQIRQDDNVQELINEVVTQHKLSKDM